MNDFTKEELESILNSMEYARSYIGLCDFDNELSDKISLMIDNFIDHELTNDTVWAFEFPENGCGGHDVNEVNLVEFSKSKNIGAGFLNYSYETKHEALQAMRNRLREIE